MPKTLKYSGKSVIIEATIRAVDKSMTYDRLLLRNVTIDGETGKDHYWVSVRNSKGLKGLKMGTVIRARARISEYISLNEKHEQITKEGLDHIKVIIRSL